MSRRNIILENETISSGSEVISDSVSLDDEGTLTIQFEGDSDSTILAFEIQGRIDSLDEWSILDEYNSDLTSFRNNNVLKQYDVLDLEEFRIICTNESRTETSLTILTSHSVQE